MTNLFDDTQTITFGDLVGEGKKYADQEAAAKAIVEKDRFIEQLKKEAADAREVARAAAEKANEALNARAFKDQMDALDQERRPLSPERNQPSTARNETEQPDYEKIVAEQLRRLTTQEKEQQATAATEAKLLEVLGPDYKAKVTQRARELGVGVEFLNSAAKVGPHVVLNLLGIEGQRKAPDNPAPPPARVSSTFLPDAGKKNYAYFRELAKTNPTLYNTPAVQNEEMKEALAQGEDFYK